MPDNTSPEPDPQQTQATEASRRDETPKKKKKKQDDEPDFIFTDFAMI